MEAYKVGCEIQAICLEMRATRDLYNNTRTTSGLPLQREEVDCRLLLHEEVLQLPLLRLPQAAYLFLFLQTSCFSGLVGILE